jgi:general secretion pathway protein A
MLERQDLRQLAQRIVARYHLGKLSKTEVAAYVQHRLGVAGTQRQLFPLALMGRLHQLSGGIPRIINVLCDRALLGAYAQGKERVDRATLDQAAREVFPQASTQRRGMRRLLVAGLAVFVAGALALVMYRQLPEVTLATAQQAVTQPAPPSLSAEAEEPAREIATPVALPQVLSWPADEPSERSRDMAYAALFKAWGADYQGTDPCLQAETLGLRCQAGRGGLDELRKSNRPAVLSMRDEQGREFFATLTALSSDSATFAIGANTTSVALSALASQWSGYYSLLWRMPPVTQRVIRPGDRGAAVEWLSRQLAQVQGRVVAMDSDWVFDDILTAQVKQFQLSQGLTPDGNAGPQTLNRLVNLADQTAPRLLREQGDS